MCCPATLLLKCGNDSTRPHVHNQRLIRAAHPPETSVHEEDMSAHALLSVPWLVLYVVFETYCQRQLRCCRERQPSTRVVS
jgi:hypothetical protein